jgi:hypothetical protein
MFLWIDRVLPAQGPSLRLRDTDDARLIFDEGEPDATVSAAAPPGRRHEGETDHIFVVNFFDEVRRKSPLL